MLMPDLAPFDLPGLERRVTAAALRQDRCAREAGSIGVRPDCPATHQRVVDMGADAATLAEMARLVSVLRRFAADEGHARPTPAPRFGIVARTIAALGRSGVSLGDARDRAGTA